MTAVHLIILAQSKHTAAALHELRQLILREQEATPVLTSEDVIFPPAGLDREGGVQAYQYLVRRIIAACSSDDGLGGYNATVVMVDSVNPQRLNIVEEAVTWDKLIAMLVLTFPELHWVFGVIYGSDYVRAHQFPAANHTLGSLLGARWPRLFDPTGLRDWIRERTGKSLAGRSLHNSPTPQKEVDYLPRRLESALAVDEETDYSYLHAYTAYRYGFRATPVCTFTLAKALLGTSLTDNAAGVQETARNRGARPWPPRVVFEDVYLNFADGKVGLSKLYADPQASSREGKGRCEEWPLIESIEHRIFVSYKQIHGEQEKQQRNGAYIAEQRTLGKHLVVINKPYEGMFRLWERSGLERRLPRGRAAGFVWPPQRSSLADNPHDHSSPGALLVVAKTMLDRAEAILNSGVSSVERAVLGAVLATDALELLGGRTPTLAVQAIRLKHQFELLAECQFAGVQHHFDVEARMKEINLEVNRVSKWFGRRTRLSSALNSEMTVLLDLVSVVRNYNQFDEEQVLMKRIRSIHNTLWMRQKSWRVVMWPVLRYTEFLLSSFNGFALSITAWVMILMGAFWIVNNPAGGGAGGNVETNSLYVAISRALESFVGKGLPNDANTATAMIFILATIAGLLHIGAFVSLLYSNVTRK